MKITIDTKEDSPEEIKNIIKMLSSLVREKPLTNQPNIFEDSSPEVKPSTSGGNIFGNIFDSSKNGETLTEEKEEEPKIEEKEEFKEDTPSVQEYH